jgi:hypothetical protein
MDRLLSEHQLDQAYHLYQILQYFRQYLGRKLKKIHPNFDQL